MNEQYQQIVDTGNRMIDQNNRGTQYPLFVIQVDKRVWVESGEDYDERERAEDVKQIWLCDRCADKHIDDQELPENCRECDEDAYEHYKIVQEFDLTAGVFFTEHAIDEHIKSNHYHYRNPQSYVISAWRNPEMVAVMHQIIKTTDKPIPSHYA